jgi:hypothetical protein
MDTIRISDCGYNYLDPGGLKDYDNNANIVQTFYPTIAGHKISVEWLEFSVEESTGCKNDVLRVYNDPDITAPLMGKYCGSTLPKNIIADNSDGALTFSLNQASQLHPVDCQRYLCAYFFHEGKYVDECYLVSQSNKWDNVYQSEPTG